MQEDRVTFLWKDYRHDSKTKEDDARCRAVPATIPASHPPQGLPTNPLLVCSPTAVVPLNSIDAARSSPQAPTPPPRTSLPPPQRRAHTCPRVSAGRRSRARRKMREVVAVSRPRR
jgi:hypothetical protein